MRASRVALVVLRPSAVRRLSSATTGPAASSSDGPSLAERASSALGLGKDEAREKASQKLLDEMGKGKGWRQALESGLIEQQRLRREETVLHQMEQLAAKEDYGFDDFADMVQQSLDDFEKGMTTMQRARLFADELSGGNTKATVEAQKEAAMRKLRIIEELTVHEKRTPKLINGKARAAIAQKLSIDVKSVNELMFEFQLQRAQWSFIRREALRGRRIPQSTDELEWMMKARPTREFMHAMRLYHGRLEALKKEREEAR